MAVAIARRQLLGAMVLPIAGCLGADTDTTPTPPRENPAVGDVTQHGDLTLTSPAFEHGGEIPQKYGYNEQNINPPLSIATAPAATESFVLIMDDPDAREPAGHVWLHWLVWNIPADTTEIPADWTPTTAIQGTNDFDEQGYGGPAPPDEPHTYRFKLYALDSTLDLDPSATKETVGSTMQATRLAQTQLEGTYRP